MRDTQKKVQKQFSTFVQTSLFNSHTGAKQIFAFNSKLRGHIRSSR